uniref:Uncharacterized protein n=1 Tax=Fomitiporia mediterranea TaxID=208960 RepID=A0A5B9RK42_9AGAM|nr:hypothetical protein Fomme_000095 [Fomitiporia mediterranea]QEG57105.1 hypothetical protein Fomme_000095 [Fomitiporia mediterranea]
MKRIYGKVIKHFQSNNQNIKSLFRSLIISISKTFLLNRLSKIRYFRPIVKTLRVFFKWSSYSALFVVIYSMLGKIFYFQYDLAFWHSLFYGAYLLYSEGILEYIFDACEYLYKKMNKQFSNIFYKLESNPKTIEQAHKIKDKVKIFTVEELREIGRRRDDEVGKIDVNVEMADERKKKFNWFPRL